MPFGLPRGQIFRSASLKLAAVYGVLFALSSYALVFFLWWATNDLLNQQVEAAIVADAQVFANAWTDGGLPPIIMAINARLAEDIEDSAIYSLNGPQLQPLAGNLNHWPANVVQAQQFYEVRVVRDGVPVVAMVYAYNLQGGAHLLVGRDIKSRAQLKHLLPGTLLYATVVVLALALVGSLVVRGLFRRMVADVSSTAAAIARGELDRRVPHAGRGDEFDAMADAINNMLDRIGRLMDGVRQVSNAIAHDLRTPITRARARLEDAASHAGTEAELRAAVERAVADLDAVTSVFQALLRIAEIEAGSRRSAFAELDLGPLLADLAELYAALAEDKGLTLTLRVPDTLPAYGDRDLVQQAVANLLDNAIKFSPSGGRITLAAEKIDGQVRLSVADQGPGIPEPDRMRATERFFRGEQARSTPGSGLGLALVQAVATLHEGTLLLEDSGPGLRATLVMRSMPPNPMPGHMKTGSSVPHGAATPTVAEPIH